MLLTRFWINSPSAVQTLYWRSFENYINKVTLVVLDEEDGVAHQMSNTFACGTATQNERHVSL